MKLLPNKSWSPVSGLFSVKPVKYYLPETYEDIVSAVKEAESMGVRIRAVGSGHSSTDIAIARGGILLDMSLLNSVFEADKSKLKADRRHEHLVTMYSGANIDTFNDDLDEMGLAFKTLGIIDHQTISGAIATGTHGCSRSLPGFPGLVRSILLVAAGGKKYRIEPADGITDPNLHDANDVELIQDDTTFSAALVHVGAFGIVASYIIEVEPQYWMLEKRTIEKWSRVSEKIRNNTLYNDYPLKLSNVFTDEPVLGLHIALNPHEVNGEHLCLIGRFFKLNGKPKRAIGDVFRSIVPGIVAFTQIPFNVIVSQANKNPQKIPKTLDGGLRKMNDASYIHKSYKVWNQGMEALAEKTYGSEFAFDGTNANWLNAIDAIFRRTKELAKDNLYSPSTLMLRYSAKSPAMLGADHKWDTVAWVGTPVPRKFTRGPEILDSHQEICIANGGISHWGKMNNNVDPQLIKTWFPQLDTWKAEMRKFNPDGTFSNDFTDRFGLTN